jgi:phosphoribosylglycinamide formyltransferase-1
VTSRKRAAVLVSGTGSNLQALIDAAQWPDYPAEIALVVSNVPGVMALERARRAGIEAIELPHRQFATRLEFDRALLELLLARGVEILCLAGFMRLLGPDLLRPFAGRVINIHPSLLPAFPGMHAQRQALEYGVKVAGCTVHFVDEGTDTGPVIAQAAVAVLGSDDETSLTERILKEEHRLYPLVLGWVAEGRVQLEGRRVHLLGLDPPH